MTVMSASAHTRIAVPVAPSPAIATIAGLAALAIIVALVVALSWLGWPVPTGNEPQLSLR